MVKKLTNILIVLVFFLVCYNCNDKKYLNKERYIVNIGDKVQIYFSTNSCCYYCIENSNELKHTSFVEEITVEDYPKGCDGCNYTGAMVLKAKSIGIDTVKLKGLIATQDCVKDTIQPIKYIIEVKQ